LVICAEINPACHGEITGEVDPARAFPIASARRAKKRSVGIAKTVGHEAHATDSAQVHTSYELSHRAGYGGPVAVQAAYRLNISVQIHMQSWKRPFLFYFFCLFINFCLNFYKLEN
jgi:hypothetical protein